MANTVMASKIPTIKMAMSNLLLFCTRIQKSHKPSVMVSKKDSFFKLFPPKCFIVKGQPFGRPVALNTLLRFFFCGFPALLAAHSIIVHDFLQKNQYSG